MEYYIEIVEGMLARKEKVTLHAVRRVAGKGSFSTISEAISVNQHAVFASKQRALFPIVRMPSLITRDYTRFGQFFQGHLFNKIGKLKTLIHSYLSDCANSPNVAPTKPPYCLRRQ